MSVSGVSGGPAHANLQTYYHQRQSDLMQLGKDLSSGDLQDAQTAYDSIVSLGQQGPFASGSPFAMANREQDFQAIGQAIQSGNASAAAQAYKALAASFHGPQSTPTDPTPVAGGSGSVPSAS